MSDQITPFSNRSSNDEHPLPERIALLFSFKLAYRDADGIRWYSVQDWITGIVPGSSGSKLWHSMKLRHVELSTRCRKLPYTIQDGRSYPMDFADAETLYLITQYLEANSGVRDEVLLYLAKSGVVLDEMIRNPEKAAEAFADLADEKETRRLMNEGFSRAEAVQWLEVRRSQKIEWGKLTTEWKTRGVSEGNEFARLTNDVSKVATKKTATALKRAMDITGTPRDYQSAADNTAIEIVSVTSRILHRQRDSQGVIQLSEDIHDVKPIIDAARPEIEKVFSDKKRILPSGKRLSSGK